MCACVPAHACRPTCLPRPPTAPSQVLALTTAPFLLDRPDVEQIFMPDAVARARKLTAAFKGGVGAYTDSR